MKSDHSSSRSSDLQSGEAPREARPSVPTAGPGKRKALARGARTAPPLPAADAPRPAGARFLFVGGCQRSGTSELTWILNRHPKIGLGMERFKRQARPKRVHKYRPDLFDRMFDFADDSTNITPETAEWDAFYRALGQKWHRVEIIGDKVPSFFLVYEQMAEAFPEAQFIQLVRNPLPVAASWSVRAARGKENWPAEHDHVMGIETWNEANRSAVRMAERCPDRFLLLDYEWFFSGAEEALEHLARFLRVNARPGWATVYARRTAGWEKRRQRRLPLTAGQVDQVVAAIDWQSWAEVRALMARG